jgi:2,6-dihydroxypseudooxynicotine hydrolase
MVDMDRYREAADRAVAALREVHRLLDPLAERHEIPFDDGTMVGNLRRPLGADRPPLVLLLPGLDSTKEEFWEWENVFLRRGMATLSLDGPGQGETGYTTHIRPDYEVAVTAALDHLQWPAPVGLAGVSLGGYYAPRAAAFEPRVVAAAGVSGPFNFGEVWDNRPSLTKETFQHHTGASSLDEARDKAFELSLDGVAERIQQPLLVVTGKNDRLVLWEESKKIADAAPNATWVLYEEGSHVCNNIPYKYRPLVADWLREQLG